MKRPWVSSKDWKQWTHIVDSVSSTAYSICKIISIIWLFLTIIPPCLWSPWPTFTPTQAGSIGLWASINVLSRIIIFIFSVSEDEWIQIEIWAAPLQRLKSAIIWRCSWSRNSASLIALKVIFRHGNPKSAQDFEVSTSWLQLESFRCLGATITLPPCLLQSC